MKLYHGNGIRVSAALVAVGMLLTASGRIGAADKVQGSAGSAVSAPPAKSSPDVWMDKWPDKMSSGAKIESSDGKYIVRGTSMKNSYGVVYRKFTVDIDKSPYISIDVTAVKGYWYLIAKNEKIKQGYVKVQADTNMTGKLIYDLRTVAGLTGTHEIELDMGVSSLSKDPNLDKSVTFSEFRPATRMKWPVPAHCVWDRGWKSGSTAKIPAQK